MVLATAVDERLVAAIWERQAFPSRALQALGLRVVFRGVPSDAGGPDFQDALLERGGCELVSGDVEFHVASGDWYRHRHDRDPGYNRVMLHVVWEDDGEPTLRQDGVAVPVLALNAWQLAGIAVTSQPDLCPHPCVDVYAALDDTELRAGIARAARVRFEDRAERFATEAAIRTPEEALYVALLESLGYASNRHAFRDLAEIVPFSWLQSIPADAWAAILLDASGLGPRSPYPPPARLRPDAWRLSRLRPANHPARRLEGIAVVLRRLGTRPVDRLFSALGPEATVTSLRCLVAAESAGGATIGDGRADEIVCSAILPFLAGVEPTSDLPWRMFERYPSPPANRWTRLMCDRLQQAGHRITVRTAIEHQGLHHLYTLHCRPEQREDCPLCGRT